jgi:nucleotide-binding universal stress UspA family protein
MKRFRKILVWIDSTDGRETALDQALAVARKSGAALTLTHALEPPQRLLRTLYPQADELHAALRREWRERLEALAMPLQHEGLQVDTRLLEGKPFLVLSREVLLGGHDLLIKPPEPSKNGFQLGSTDMHLLRKCPSAVWITNQDAPSSERILALVDPDPAEEEINRRILQMATSLAELRGTTVDVLHAWEASGEQLLAHRMPTQDVEAYVEETRALSTHELEQLVAHARVDINEEHVHLQRGSVRRVVPDFVRENDIGLIVMGTLGRAGLRGVLIGNTAETILSRVSCPVLTVKPRDFVSPLAT